jgi:hypothetical protein
LGLQQGSRTQVWCYDAAAVSSVGGLTNGPSSGSASLTVAGSGFGSDGFSGRVRVGRGDASGSDMMGGSGCEMSGWRSSSGVLCKLSAGVGGGSPMRRGQGLPVVVTVGLQQGSRTQVWCYDAAAVSSVGGLTNGPSSGSASLTVAGSGFGSDGFSDRVRVGRGDASGSDMMGGSGCEMSGWRSSSGVLCKLSAGVGGGSPMRRGQGLPVVVTVGLQQGSRTQVWCYDAAAVSSVGGLTNGPSSGSASLTVAGSGFGSDGFSGRVRVGRGDASGSDMMGGSGCEMSGWRSSSGVLCKLSAGVGGGSPMRRGQGLPVVVTVGLQQGSRTQVWCYDAAAVSSVGGLTNGPSSGSASLTVAGSGFGSDGFSGRVRVGRGDASDSDMMGGSGCEMSGWRSSSGVLCKLSAGVGGGSPMRRGQGLPVVVTVGLQQGSRTQVWCYDAAAVSSVGGLTNGPSSGSASLTVAGSGFGSDGFSGRVRVGRGDASDSDMMGGSGCEMSGWRSSSGVLCKLSAGVGGGSPMRRGQGLPVVVTVGLQQGSRTQVWCYDAAAVSSVGGLTNGPSSGSASLTVAGSGFGSDGFSGRVRVGRGDASDSDMMGGSGCEMSGWRSSSGVLCKLSAGVGGGSPMRRGQGLPVVVTVGLQQGSRTQVWCYDAAAVSSVGGLTNGPSSGSASLTVAGSGFGSVGFSGRVRVGRGDASGSDMMGGSGCEMSGWRSSSGVLCKLSAGVGGGSPMRRGQGLPVVVTVGLQQGSRTQVWCYDAAAVSSVGGLTNGPSSGSASLTVAGSGFGSVGFSGRVRVGRGDASGSDMMGGSGCEMSGWRSSSGVLCKLSAGVGGGSPMRRGQGLPVVVTVGLQQGSRTQVWCYDAAAVSSVGGLTNGPSSGSASLTVAGSGFGSVGFSGRVRVGRGDASDSDMMGGSGCEMSGWRSSSGVLCKLSAGVGGGSPMRRGQGLPVVVTVGLQQGSRTQVWCYDAAAVSSVGGLTNGPSSGSASLTVAGSGFGSVGFSGRVRVGRGDASGSDMMGGSGCEMSGWRSSSGVLCKLSAGVGGGSPMRRGQGLPVVVTVGLQQGSRTQVCCYDAAAVSSVGGLTNGPSSGSASLTVAGSGFGIVGFSGRIGFGFGYGSFVSSSSLDCTIWISVSSVFSKVSSGLGPGKFVFVSVGLVFGYMSSSFSYDEITISQIPTSFVSTGSFYVQMRSSNVGLFDYSPRSSIGFSNSLVSSWVSYSMLRCKVSTQGFVSSSDIIASISNIYSTTSRAFSFTRNAMIYSLSSNVSSVLGPLSNQSTNNPCNVSLNSSAIKNCTQIGDYSQSTIANKSSVNWPFSCMNCSLLQTNNFPTTASNLIAILGVNYASVDSSLKVRFSSAASMSRWFSDSLLVSKISAGRQGLIFTAATVNSQKGDDHNSLISFDLFHVFRVQPSGVPSTGGFQITALGSHFGVLASSLSVLLQTTVSESSVWNSHSSIRSKSSAIIYHNPSLSVSIGLNTSILVGDPLPSIIQSIRDFSPKSRPVTGASFIRFSGANMGFYNPSFKIAVGVSQCESSLWHSGTHVVCKLPRGYSQKPEFTLSVFRVQRTFELLPSNSTLSRPVFLSAKALQRSVLLSWNNSGPGQPKSISVFDSIDGTMTISSVALFLKSKPFRVLRDSATSVLYTLTAASQLYVVFHFDFEITFSVILGKPAPFAAPLQLYAQPTGNLRSSVTWKFLDVNEAPFSKWKLSAVDSRNSSNVILEGEILGSSTYSYLLDVSSGSGVTSAQLELVALNDFDQVVVTATALVAFARIPQPLLFQLLGSRRDVDIRLEVSWVNIVDRLTFEISLQENFASYTTFEVNGISPASTSRQVVISGNTLIRNSVNYIRYFAHYLTLSSSQSATFALEYHIVPKVMYVSPKSLIVSRDEAFLRLTVALSRPCCISGDGLCVLTSDLPALRIGNARFSMLLDPYQIGTDYSLATSIDFILSTPDVSGLATIQVPCDDGNVSTALPVIFNNPLKLVNIFPSEVSKYGGSVIRCVVANVAIRPSPSAIFVNISGAIINSRIVSLESDFLTVEFTVPLSPVSGLQNIELYFGNSKMSFFVMRTGKVHIVELIPDQVTAGIRTDLRIVVQSSRCNVPELFLNGIVLRSAAVESSAISESLSLYIYSTFIHLSSIGSVNVTVHLKCDVSATSATEFINVVSASTPSLHTTSSFRDNFLNNVNLVFTSPSVILNLETFVILPSVGPQLLSTTPQSHTTRCAPSCFFLFSIQIPLGTSSIRFTLRYFATGMNATQSISATFAVRGSNEIRILRVLPSVLDSRGGQLMFLSVGASASVHNFSLASPAFPHTFPCQTVAVINLTSNYSNSKTYTHLRQMFEQESRYLDQLVSSISVLEGIASSSVAVVVSPYVPFTRLDSDYGTKLELWGASNIAQEFVRVNISGNVPAADNSDPVINVQNEGILELRTASFFRASGRNFPPIAFKSNIAVSSEQVEAPPFIVKSWSWNEGAIFLECEFVSLSLGSFVYIIEFSPASGNFSVKVDISIIDSTDSPVITSVEPAFLYASSGIRILNISVRNAMKSTAVARVDGLNCGIVTFFPTMFRNVMFAYVPVNTTALTVGDAKISLVFANQNCFAHLSIMKMPLQFVFLRSSPEALLCTAGGRRVDVLAKEVPRIFNTSFLRLSCPVLDPAPFITSASINHVLSLSVFVPPQKACATSTAFCLVSFPDPSCSSSCFFNFSIRFYPDFDSLTSSVSPPSGPNLMELLVSVKALNVLSPSQSVLRYQCDDSDVSVGPQSSQGIFSGPGASMMSLIPLRLYLNRSLSSPVTTNCSVKSVVTSQVVSFHFTFQPSEFGSYLQHTPTQWVAGEQFTLTLLALDGSRYPILGCIMTTIDPNSTSSFVVFNASGTIFNVSGTGWRSASMVSVSKKQISFRLSFDPIAIIGKLNIFMKFLASSGDQVSHILIVEVIEPEVPLIVSLIPRIVTQGSPFQLITENMPNSTSALRLIVTMKLPTGSEFKNTIIQNTFSRKDMYTSLALICLAPSFEFSSSASVTLMVYDAALPHRVAFMQIILVRPADAQIVSFRPNVVSMNVATALAVEVDNFLRWESCDLVAAFVSSDTRIPTKILTSTVIEEKAYLKVLSPVLREADDFNLEIQCKERKIFSATTLFVSNPARLSIVSFSPTSITSSSGGVIELLIKSSVPVIAFSASVEISNFEPKLADVNVVELPDLLFQMRIFVDPFVENVLIDTLGTIRILPDSRIDQSARLQIMFTASRFSLKAILPNKVSQGLATPVIAELLNVPPFISNDIQIKSQQIPIELPQVLSCTPSRCFYRFIVDLSRPQVYSQIDLTFSFPSAAVSNPISHSILVSDPNLCDVIDVAPSLLSYNRTNDIVIRVSALSIEFFNIQLSFGVQEIVANRKVKMFGNYVLLSLTLSVSSMKNAWLFLRDDTCSSNLTFAINPFANANVIQVTPTLVSSGQTVVVDIAGLCPQTFGVYMPLLNSFESLPFTARNLTETICSLVVVMPLFEFPSEIWLNFSHISYSISAPLSSVPGCSDCSSLEAFCISLGLIADIFSNFQRVTCDQSACLNPLDFPKQVVLKHPHFVNLQKESIISVSIKWLYATRSSDVAVLLDEQYFTSFKTTRKSDNITNIDISVPSLWSIGMHSVEIYSNLIGRVRNSSFSIEARIPMIPNVSFVLPSTALSFEDSSSLKIGISSFPGSLNDSRIMTLTCTESIVESMIPVSISVDNLLSVSAKFKPSRSSTTGIADVWVDCMFVYPKIENRFTASLSLKVKKRATRILYFSPDSVVNGADQTLTVEATGIYEKLCLYINDVNISDSSKIVFEPSVSPAVKVFKILTPLIGSYMSSPAFVSVFIGSCSPPLRRAAEGPIRLQVLPQSLPLILSITPSVMAYTSTGVTLIGQFFDGVQHVSLFSSSPVTMMSWNIISTLSGAGNRTEILVLFQATAPDNVILNVRIRDSELQGYFTLTHSPTITRPDTFVMPVPFGTKIVLSSSRILPTFDFTRTQLIFNNQVSIRSLCEYRSFNVAECSVPYNLPSGRVSLSLMVKSQVILNDTTVLVLPTPEIFVVSAAKFLLVGGDRELRVTVKPWPCVLPPIITLNQIDLLFTLTEQNIGVNGFFSASIQIPDVAIAGFQKLVVSGVFDGNTIFVETLVQFYMNAPSIALASGRTFMDSTVGQSERILCRHFPRISRSQDIIVKIGNIFVPSTTAFSSDQEEFSILDVVIPAQLPQIVTVSVCIRDICASVFFEYRVPALTAICSDEKFATTLECSVSASGGSLYVQISPAIDGITTYSAYLQTSKLPLSINLSSPIFALSTRLEIFVPARFGTTPNTDLLCISALGMGSILCVTLSYKVAAVPLSAVFDSFGTSIIISFASESQMHVDCQLIFAPETFDLLGGKQTMCLWTSSTLLRVVLPPESIIVPGDKIRVYVANLGAFNTSSIEVQPPLQSAALDVELIGPGNISVCDLLELDAVVSFSRSLVYSWSCLPPCPLDVDAHLRSVTGPRFVASASTLPTGVSLAFLVTVTTFLGASASSEPLYIYIHSSPLPSISISPSAIKLLRQDFLELTAISAFASCTVQFERVTFAWSVQTKAPISDTVNRVIQSATQSVLLLQPHSLIGGYEYHFRVSIKTDAMKNSAGVRVTVLPGKLVALVDGGSRTVSTRDLVVLDGSRSFDFDANRGVGQNLHYCWTCQRSFGNDFEPCKYTQGPLFGTLLQLPCLQVIRVSLQNITTSFADRFKFSLILRSIDGRIDSDYVTLSLSSYPDTSLDVYIRSSCDADICKDSESIVLTANASVSFTYKWTLVHSPKLESPLKFDSSNSLVRFQPMDLPPGNYEFICFITDSKLATGQTSIKFQVAASPKGGSCQCSIPSAPSTTSLVTCSGWNTLFPPLR